MGASAPNIPDPTAETPGVIIGDAGFAVSRQLAKLTGQPGRIFRQQAATQSPSNPVGFLRDLLKQERQRLRAERTSPQLPSEPPARSDPAVQDAARREQRRAGRGRSSTILTALEGTVNAADIARKTLLGGF